LIRSRRSCRSCQSSFLSRNALASAERIAPIEIGGPEFAARCKDGDAFDKPAPPVGIFGNTYLVGTCGISSILITDPAGDILIDGGTEDDADLIAANITSLGFRLSDIKYILLNREHSTMSAASRSCSE
jgi:metallo-beta-lactamase class B